MEFVINQNTIIGLAGTITALLAIVGVIASVVRQFIKWNSYDKKIQAIDDRITGLQKEQYLQIKTERAILDGLHQLGCNGSTTSAAHELDDFLLKRAHDLEK